MRKFRKCVTTSQDGTGLRLPFVELKNRNFPAIANIVDRNWESDASEPAFKNSGIRVGCYGYPLINPTTSTPCSQSAELGDIAANRTILGAHDFLTEYRHRSRAKRKMILRTVSKETSRSTPVEATRGEQHDEQLDALYVASWTC